MIDWQRYTRKKQGSRISLLSKITCTLKISSEKGMEICTIYFICTMNFVTCNMGKSFGGILNVKFMDNHPSRAKKSRAEYVIYRGSFHSAPDKKSPPLSRCQCQRLSCFLLFYIGLLFTRIKYKSCWWWYLYCVQWIIN